MLPKAAEVGLAGGAVRCAPPSWAGGEEADLKASPSSGIDLDSAMLANRLGLRLGLGLESGLLSLTRLRYARKPVSVRVIG